MLRNPISNNIKITSVFALLLMLLNCLAVLVISWSCYRGLDLSDESYYYMGYLYFNNNPNLSPASFHLIYGRLFSFLDFTLTEVRFLRLVLTVAASAPLYFGLEKIIAQKNKAEKFVLFNIILSGMLLSYSWGPLALSYNTMSCVLIASISGFWVLAAVSNNQYYKAIYSVLLGFLFTLLFFAKITNILLLPILIATTIYWTYKRKPSEKTRLDLLLIQTIFFGLGILASLALISGKISLISETLENYFQQSFALSNEQTHSIEYLKKRYYDNAEMVITRLKYPLILLVAVFAVLQAYLVKNRSHEKSDLQTLFKIIGAVILIIIVVKNKYWMGGAGVHYQVLIAYIFIGVLVFLNRFLENENVNFVLLLCLLSIPIAGAIGTNNGLSVQVLLYAVFLFLTLYYLVNSTKNFWYKHIVLAVLVLLCTSQIITATVFKPYRQAKLTETREELEGVEVFNKLKVDSRVFSLREKLAFLGHIKAKYVFAYSSHRGMAMLANKKPYSLEWFHEDYIEKMCMIINKSKIEAQDIIFLIPEEMPLENAVIKCLENNGIFFKDGYTLIKSIKFYDQKKRKELTLNVYQPSTDTFK